VPVTVPPPSQFFRLRGAALSRAVDLLVELREQGRARWTCPRLLAAGAVTAAAAQTSLSLPDPARDPTRCGPPCVEG